MDSDSDKPHNQTVVHCSFQKFDENFKTHITTSSTYTQAIYTAPSRGQPIQWKTGE